LLRRSAGNSSRRWNIVGTHWLCVIASLSISESAESASKRFIKCTVPPLLVTASAKRSGAA